MEAETPPQYRADDCCVDCGKGVSPTQAGRSKTETHLSRAFGDDRNREGFVLCRSCLDKERRSESTHDRIE